MAVSVLGSEVEFGRGTIAVSALLLAAAFVTPFVTTDYVTGLAVNVLVFVMLGVSWNLIAGYAGQVSLGHAAFFGLGAYVSAWLTTPGNADLPQSLAMHPLLAFLLGGVGAALVALVLGPIMFRLRGHYFAIGTLALATIIQLVLTDLRSISGGATGYYLQGDMGTLTVTLFTGQTMSASVIYLITVVITALAVVGTYLVAQSRLGLGMKAIHDDETAASGLGVSPLRLKMYAFVISSFVAGLAGAAYALNSLYINPSTTLGVTWTIDSLVIVVLGGMGTFVGPILGTAIFVVLDSLLISVVGGLATTVEGIIIILFVIFLPQGAWGFLRDWYEDRQ